MDNKRKKIDHKPDKAKRKTERPARHNVDWWLFYREPLAGRARGRMVWLFVWRMGWPLAFFWGGRRV